MPYKHREPVSEQEMERSRYEGHHSICQTLRDMYHETTDENIKLKCRLCVAMAKAMNKKLQDYKYAEEERKRKEKELEHLFEEMRREEI